VFASAARADEAVLDAAVAAGPGAFPAWSALPLPERAALMHKLADSLQDHADQFARLIVMEQGKPLSEAQHEAPMGIRLLRYMADNVDYAPVVLKSDGDKKVVEHRRPLGVVAAITPWNVPLGLLLVKLAPALFAGNTVVAKPVPTTPLSTCLLAEIWNEILRKPETRAPGDAIRRKTPPLLVELNASIPAGSRQRHREKGRSEMAG
jgi:acyl-CoA reductase-like NAD-dependent aldehyde dehydrogenase